MKRLGQKGGSLRHAPHTVGAVQNSYTVGWRFNLPTLTDSLCSRNARSEKGGRGTARPSFLLAEAARSECAPSMRAVKDSLAAPLRAKWQNRSEGPRSTRAVEDQSASTPEERTIKLGRSICSKACRTRVLQALLCVVCDREAPEMVAFYRLSRLTLPATSRSLSAIAAENGNRMEL